MNPSSKGWLKHFIYNYFLSDDFLDILNQNDKNLLDEERLYRIIQTTGLIYGYPSQFFAYENIKSKEWNDKEKIKLIIIESFLIYLFLSQDKKYDKTEDLHSHVEEFIKKIAEFYKVIFPALAIPIVSKDNFEFVEKVIDKRINIKYKVASGFWTSLFQNSLIFLDLVYFSRYINNKQITDFEEREEIKSTIIKIIAAAAHSNKSINKEEKRLFEYFLHSAHLDKERTKIAKEYFKNGIELDQIDLNTISSWIIKKFCLEIAVLTIWSDRRVSKEEHQFIEKLNTKLGFCENELDSSMLAVESFILNNSDKIFFLANQNNYQVLSKSLQDRLVKMLIKNKSMLVQELSESKELLELIAKSSTQKLTHEEKKKVKNQLFDILRTIPSFAIFMVPGGSILLPFLLKIIPENLMKPSSFTNKSE